MRDLFSKVLDIRKTRTISFFNPILFVPSLVFSFKFLSTYQYDQIKPADFAMKSFSSDFAICCIFEKK